EVMYMQYLQSHSSVQGVAQVNDGDKARPFKCRNSVNFISNDDGANQLLVNLDSPVGSAGTFTLWPGEAMSDLIISCRELYVQGVGGPVAFRALGA
ncbi:MAG: hypothetical protein FWD16_07155, partial [Clostridia bacterium]|nr:hypothetical protein [Clostridia bacterium]